MPELTVTIGWQQGLHARPAAIFVRAATGCGVPVTIAKPGGEPVNAVSLLGVLGLAALGGEVVVLASDAPGADGPLERLAKLVEQGLDELPTAL